MKTKDLTIDFLKVKVEELLKTLPIAHYLKIKTIEIVFDENAQTSYFDPQNYNIHLALANIVMAIMGSKQTEINDIDLEKHIRNTLYHEVSHAILTPVNLFNYIESYRKDYANRKANDPNWKFEWLLDNNLANIIEDERIETILKDYYLLVDFKANVYNINDGISNAQTFEQFVFNAVRFRYSPIKNAEINNKVNDFIKNNARVNSMNCGYMAVDMNNLVVYLKSLWDELTASQNQQNNQQSNSQDSSSDEEDSSSCSSEEQSDSQNGKSSQSENQENGDDSSKEETQGQGNEDNAEDSQDSSSKHSLEDKSSAEGQSNNGTTESENKIDSNVEDIEKMLESFTEEQINDLIAKAIMEWKKQAQRYGKYTISLEDITEDSSVLTQMIKIIVKNTGTGVAESPSQYGYCGRFNAKKFMKDYNESYKWFEKKSFSDNTLNNNSQNKVLNIFLDNSGSYWRYDESTNKVLKALYEIEKRYTTFKFNLICWGSDYVCEQGANRLSRAGTRNWGTYLVGFRKVYKEFNKTGKEYNILLTDGSIDYINELDAMNNNKSVVISASANKKTIKTLCKNAKAVIFEDCDYASALAQNVINALDSLF